MRMLWRLGLGLAILALVGLASNCERQQQLRKAARLRELFELPAEAIVIDGDCREWLGIAANIEFRLPRTRTPEQWLKVLAERSGNEAAPNKNDPLLYDRGGDCGHGVAEIRYVPPATSTRPNTTTSDPARLFR